MRSVGHYAGLVEPYDRTVEQCGGTVWNDMEEQWNSVAQCGGAMEQCGTAWWNSVVEQCGAAWWNSGKVEQCGTVR